MAGNVPEGTDEFQGVARGSAIVRSMPLDAQLLDQAGQRWGLADQRGAAALLVFLRGDW